jgi:uracil-DNA glycosylase
VILSQSEFETKQAQQSLSALVNNIRLCKACEHKLPLAPKPIVQLNAKAKILIAGQAPGSIAHHLGVAFQDKSGERLRDWMGIAEDEFFDPEKVAILPMGFCYPGKGKSGDLPPTSECAELWRKKLLLPNIRITLLIGAYSQKWHLVDSNKKTLSATVENWQNYWPEQCPMPHPSPRNNIWLKKNAWFEKELIPVLKDRIKSILNS